MRRMIIPVMLAVVLAAPCGAQQKESDTKHEGLAGKVKSVKTEEAKVSTKAGKLLEGKRQFLSSDSYNEAGALVKAKKILVDSPADYFYSYDANGDRSEFVRLSTRSKRGITRFKYDARGKRIEQEYSDDEVWLKTAYVYDTQGRRTEASSFGKQGLLFKTTYTYDAHGQVSVEIEYDSKGAVRGTKSYAYELVASGNWTKRTTSEQVAKNGQTSFEPVEVTYRTIVYY